MKITVFGLGEAGSLIAADLAARGAEVDAFDPAEVPTPAGVRRHEDAIAAVPGADLVLAITASDDSRAAMSQAWNAIPGNAIYADLSTSSPQLKLELAGVAAERDTAFADVALMAPVPGRGLATPALASGTGAEGLAAAFNPLGGRVEVIGGGAGAAVARKLTRSVVTKGLAALVSESMAAAEAAGEGEWAWRHVVDLLTSTDEDFVRRLIEGTQIHTERRLVEMEAVRDYLLELGVPADMTTGTIEQLRRAV